MSANAAARGEWRGGGRSLSWLVRWIGISLLLHAPFTPLAGLIGLALLLAPQDDAPDLPPITEIPLEILPDTETSVAEPAPAAPAPTEAAASAPAEPAKEAAKPIVQDAGAPLDAGPDASRARADAGLDAGVPDAEAPDAALADAAAKDADASAADAGREASDAGDAGVERRPLAVSGARGVVDPNANVKVLIDSQRLRGHPLGPRIGKLLGSIGQWRDFFGPTGIDPVKDIDRIFITGPQLRDSSGVVALIRHRIPEARLKEALNALVSRDPEGQWLEGKVPTAKARADRAQRYFVLPSANLLVVTPESALKSAQRIGPRSTLPSSPPPEIVTAHVQTPWRVFLGTPISVPKSLRWAEAHVTPQEDGGAVVRLVAEDEDAATAAVTARQLERGISDGLEFLANATNIFALIFGGNSKKLVQKIEFRTEGNTVVGVLTFTEAQVVEILDRVSRLLGARGARPAPRAASSAAGGAAAVGTTSEIPARRALPGSAGAPALRR